MDARQHIKDYLNEAIIMQLATAANNKPWVCNLHFVADEKMNMYWISRPDRRHSQEIRENKYVAGTVALPHEVEQPVRGLQFEGIAEEISDKQEAEKAMKLYVEKLKMDEDRAQKIVNGEDNHVVYVVRPKRIVLFDVVNFPNNPQQELKLA